MAGIFARRRSWVIRIAMGVAVAVGGAGSADVRAAEPASDVEPEGGPQPHDDGVAGPEPSGPDDDSPTADQPEPAPEPEPELDAEAVAAAARFDAIERRLAELERENAALREEVSALRKGQRKVARKVDGLLPLKGQIGGYVDVGFFWVGGDGTGFRVDDPPTTFPEFAASRWVFMGDPLSVAINARGDPAHTGDSRAIEYEPIGNGGRASFILNALNLNLSAQLGDSLVVGGLVDFLPRTRNPADSSGVNLGDFVDIKLAYVRYLVPAQRFDLDLYAGKIDSVFGYEYRYQEAPDRIAATPSLICRYTCGRPTGLAARWRFLDQRRLIWNLALTNGAPLQEQFGFFSEVDFNDAKTGTTRLAYKFPVGAGLTIGASGSVGAQGLQTSDKALQYQYGFDLRLDIRGFEMTGEFISGEAEGRSTPDAVAPCGVAPCIDLMGAYGMIGYRITNFLMPYFRADWRDALHRNGTSFVYISEVTRLTPGVRFEIGQHVIIKAQYTVNLELGKIPQFPNDVFTSSLVAKF